MKGGRAGLVGLLMAFVSLVAAGCGPRRVADGRSLYACVRRASVFVLVDGRHTGSGFFADAEGLVVTAAHMVKGHTEHIEVVSPVVGRRKAQRIALDFGHDLALLRVPKRDEPYPSLPIARRLPAAGAEVLLFGDPVFRHHLLLAGRVAVQESTYSYNQTLRCYTRAFYIAGTSPDGTSGGCWVDRRGRVVGVQSGYLNTAKAPAGIAIACPPDAIRRLVATRRSPPSTTLGTQLDELWTQPKGFIARFPKGTVGVVTVVPHKDGPAAKANLNKESLILAIDGKPIAYVDELMAIIRSKKPGDHVTLQVMAPDSGARREAKVALARVAE